MGYDVVVEDGHFLSRDGRHAMLIVQTTVPMMDGGRSKELVEALGRGSVRCLSTSVPTSCAVICTPSATNG